MSQPTPADQLAALEPMTLPMLRDYMGYARETMYVLKARRVLPEPDYVSGDGKLTLWARSTVERWIAQTGRERKTASAEDGATAMSLLLWMAGALVVAGAGVALFGAWAWLIASLVALGLSLLAIAAGKWLATRHGYEGEPQHGAGVHRRAR